MILPTVTYVFVKNHVEPYHILCFILQYHMYVCDGIIEYGMEQYGTMCHLKKYNDTF